MHDIFYKKTEQFLSWNINFDEEMEKWLLDFILILKEFIEKILLIMYKEIAKDKNRKNDYYLEKRAVTKCVLHKIGVVEIKRNYYQHYKLSSYLKVMKDEEVYLKKHIKQEIQKTSSQDEEYTNCTFDKSDFSQD